MWPQNIAPLHMYYFCICKMEIFFLMQTSLLLRVISQLIHSSLIHLFSMIISKESLHMLKDNHFCGPQKRPLFVLCTGWTSHFAKWGLDLDHIFYNSLTKINLFIDHSFISTLLTSMSVFFLLSMGVFSRDLQIVRWIKPSPNFPILSRNCIRPWGKTAFLTSWCNSVQ